MSVHIHSYYMVYLKLLSHKQNNKLSHLLIKTNSNNNKNWNSISITQQILPPVVLRYLYKKFSG